MILVDASGLIANYDLTDPHHAAVARILASPQQRLLLSPFVLAEVDYMVAQIAGQAAELAVLEDVALGGYDLAAFSAPDVAAARAVIGRYSDLSIGLADASIVVLAERYGCLDILTLDQRHFRALRDSRGRPFRLLPFDAAAV